MRSAPAFVAGLGALALVPALAGCSSTTAKAEEVARGGTEAFAAKGLSVAKVNRDVDVVSTTLLRDANGAAAVVTLRNETPRALGAVPVALSAQDRAGSSLWKNDAPGLERALTQVPSLPPRRSVTWVNDQVLAVTGTPTKVVARVGAAQPAGTLPRVRADRPAFESDPGGSTAARGKVRNLSSDDLRDVVIYGVARRGDRVVAAGRSIVPRLRPRATADYAIFFIGDPRRGDLEVTAAPFPAPTRR